MAALIVQKLKLSLNMACNDMESERLKPVCVIDL
jgi:hypothetical protein